MSKRKMLLAIISVIKTALTQKYMPEQELMPYSWKSTKVEETKVMTPNANYDRKKLKT